MPAFVIWKKSRRRWIVRARFGGTERDYTIGPRAEDEQRAEALAERLNYEHARRAEETEDAQFGVDADGGLGFAHLARAFLHAYGWNYSAQELKSLEIRVRKHLVPAFGHMDLRDVSDSDVQAYVAGKLETGLAPNTIANSLSALRRIINIARSDGLIDKTPAPGLGRAIRKLQRQGLEARDVSAWSHAERDRILALAREHEPLLALPLMIGFYTGARRGEILGLWWEDVDHAAGQVHLRWQLTNQLERKRPKWNSQRSVPMAAALEAVLRDHAARTRRRAPWADPTYVVEGPNGGLFRPDTFQRAYARLIRRAKAAGIRPLTMHCTRHTFATHAIEGGKSVKWVSTMLGHRSSSFTLDLYGHLLPGEIADLSFLGGSGSAARSRPSPSPPGPRSPDPTPAAAPPLARAARAPRGRRGPVRRG